MIRASRVLSRGEVGAGVTVKCELADLAGGRAQRGLDASGHRLIGGLHVGSAATAVAAAIESTETERKKRVGSCMAVLCTHGSRSSSLVVSLAPCVFPRPIQPSAREPATWFLGSELTVNWDRDLELAGHHRTSATTAHTARVSMSSSSPLITNGGMRYTMSLNGRTHTPCSTNRGRSE